MIWRIVLLICGLLCLQQQSNAQMLLLGTGGGGFGGAPAVATGFTASGPSSGTAGSPSTNFTVTAVGGPFSGTQTITIADGTKGGTITPSVGSPGTSTVTVTPTAASSSFTFTYTAVLGDSITLAFTNGQSWSNPSSLPYLGAVTVAASGPGSGTVGSASTNFTVSMPAGTKFSGTDTITIADASQGGTITPSVGSPGTSTVTVTPAASATSFTFTYTPAVAGALTLTLTNGQSWTNPSGLSYTSNALVGVSGPSSGAYGVASTNYTVTLTGTTFNGSTTVTIADGSKGGTFTPSVGSPSANSVTVTPTNGASSFTFTYKPIAVGAITLTYTNAQSWTNPSPGTYTSSNSYAPQGVVLNSTGDLRLTGGLSGKASSKSGLVSVWIKNTNASVAARVMINFSDGTTNNYMQFYLSGSSGRALVVGDNSAATQILVMQSNTVFTSMSSWSNIIMSWNLATGRGQIYTNDASDLLAGPTLTNDTIAYATASQADVGSGFGATGGNYLGATTATQIADLQFWQGVDVDISVAANRRNFNDGSGSAVNPTIAAANLGTPILANYGVATSWQTNKGSGTGFTLFNSSTISNAASSPP